MSKNQIVIDLVNMAESLPANLNKLKRLILQLRDAHSMRTDLQMAFDFVGSMEELRDRTNRSQMVSADENVFLGLLYSSIILYARATKTSSGHRKYRYDFFSNYDDDEKVKHENLCALRDDTLAHFGPGKIHGKAFHSDGVFLIFDPDGSGQVATLSSRIIIPPSLIDTLRQMTHRALMLVGRRLHELDGLVTEEITKSPDLRDLIQAHRIDFAKFVGSEKAAQEILGGPRVGYRRGSARH